MLTPGPLLGDWAPAFSPCPSGQYSPLESPPPKLGLPLDKRVKVQSFWRPVSGPERLLAAAHSSQGPPRSPAPRASFPGDLEHLSASSRRVASSRPAAVSTNRLGNTPRWHFQACRLKPFRGEQTQLSRLRRSGSGDWSSSGLGVGAQNQLRRGCRILLETSRNRDREEDTCHSPVAAPAPFPLPLPGAQSW